MRVGVVAEIKPAERRVGLTPAGAAALVADGHDVLVQTGAGVGAGFGDEDYLRAGARIVSVDQAWGDSELLVKVKEPIAAEYGYLRSDLTLFTYLHLAADRPLTEALMAAKTTAIAYETVRDESGALPLLAPMSEVAGRLAAQAAAHHLQHPFGGPGLLIGGVPGVPPARVVVIGGGVVGTQAALVAVGMQADVTILDSSPRRLRQLDEFFGPRAQVVMSDPLALEEAIVDADVLIGAVLVPGAAAPKLVRADHLPSLKPAAVLVDVAIDQGGCFETSRPTTYLDPTYRVAGILHYCVANMPGAVPRTSTRALTNATLPYVRKLAGLGPDLALAGDEALQAGLNVRDGLVRHAGVATAFPDLAS
ncbi:alanine dehydrogenase [Planosporangium flavigriseum]|uniref:Alanine dehydrogenase n=1 Tax=Planosporangium flavigriseum TaxID=373681 RepID=A0A8J3LQB0_9ACTN|nr:alanine dehydrogenase [Planosporangium flavigriseum]NJC67720.1 alanine dehydrogenase [Planosporangium flavigriseum]GIG75997.1 alanine dehydrogenase [Planosporangium flavigriseum]